MADWVRRSGGFALVIAAVPAGLGVLVGVCAGGACRYGRSLAGPGVSAMAALLACLFLGLYLVRAEPRLLRLTGNVLMLTAVPFGAGAAFVSRGVFCQQPCGGDYMVMEFAAVAGGVLVALVLVVAGGLARWAGGRDRDWGAEVPAAGKEEQ